MYLTSTDQTLHIELSIRFGNVSCAMYSLCAVLSVDIRGLRLYNTICMAEEEGLTKLKV